MSNTLRQMIEDQYGLSAHCQNYQPICTHYATLKLEMLVQRLGWDFDIIANRSAFRGRLVCSICGARFPGLIVSPQQPEASCGVGGSHGGSAMMSVEESTKYSLALNKAYREHNAAQPEPYEWKGKRKGGRKFGRR